MNRILDIFSFICTLLLLLKVSQVTPGTPCIPSQRAATSGCTSAAWTRSILFAAQFSRIDISSGVSRRSTTMSSNSTVVNVSENHPQEGVARAREGTAGFFLFLLASFVSSSSSAVTFFLLSVSHLSLRPRTYHNLPLLCLFRHSDVTWHCTV